MQEVGKMSFIAKLRINNDEIKIVARGIMSCMLAKGKVVAKFGTAFAKYDGVNHAE
jgi:dTDP-4-amino-4,6-dideoxygalactose transaminase